MKGMVNDLAAFSIEELSELVASHDSGAERLKESFTFPSLEDTEVVNPVASLAQERLWFMDKLVPGNPFYNIPFGLRLEGKLDVEAFSLAWTAVLERHAALRSYFANREEGTPGIAYLDAQQMRLTVLGAETAPRLALLMEKEARMGFDLERGPLIRGLLVEEKKDCHAFLFTVHHIVFDGWSIGVFLRDLIEAYVARLHEKSPVWADLPVTYEQYAVWHRAYVEQVAQQESEWWREQMANLPDLDMPTDYMRPEQQSFKGAMSDFNVPAETTRAVEAFAAAEGLTPFVIWLSIFAMILSRRSGLTDFAVGSGFAARNDPGVENLVGFFVENLCVRINSDPEISFRSFLHNTAATVFEAIEHGNLPFQMIAGALGRERDLSRNPVYQAAFTYQSMPENKTILDGLEISGIAVPLHSTHLDLEILAWPHKNGLHCQFLYATDLFDEETVLEIAREFSLLAGAAVHSPDASLHSLGLEETPSFCSGPVRSCPVTSPYTLFSDLCVQNPAATALVVGVENGAARHIVTRQNLLDMADLYALKLVQSGIGSGDIVGLHLEQGPELLASMLAVWRLGAVWTPIIPNSPPAVTGWMLADAKAQHVITRRSLWTRMLRMAVADDELRRIAVSFVDDLSLGANGGTEGVPDSPATPRRISGEDVACILYTSGSTGRPKGVMLNHKALANRFQWMWDLFPWQPGEVACQKTSPAFVDFLWESFGPLLRGVPLVVIPSAKVADIGWFIDLLDREHVSRLVLVPSLLASMLAVEGGLAGRLAGLRFLTSSGELLPPSLAMAALQALPAARLLNLYGSTEVTADATWHEVAMSDKAGVPIGMPLSNVCAAVVSASGEVLPRGGVGELYIAGDCLASGYCNGQAFTEGKLLFGGHPVEPSGRERWVATGDLARMERDGRLVLLGRKDRQLKVRGIRIEPEEVQRVLESHPFVKEARVIGVKSRRSSQEGHVASVSALPEDNRLAAYIIPDKGKGKKDEAEDRALCLRQWEHLYDSMYSVVRQQGGALDNFFIWHSSYDGGAIPQQEMLEWLKATLDGIQALGARRILEVGCGQGFILMNMLRHCEAFTGVDFSAQALDCLRDLLAQHPDMQGETRVDLVQAEATGLSVFEPASFDAAVYNSVVQYFPDHQYLLRALEQVLPLLDANGTLFLGDIRNYAAEGAFHAAVQFHQLGDDATVVDFLDNMQAKRRLESELLVAPAFWGQLGRLSSRFVHAAVRPKCGRSDNELFQFRYDVSLYLDRMPGTIFNGETTVWGSECNSLADLGALLEKKKAENAFSRNGLAVIGIPNARISHFKLLETLAQAKGTVAAGTTLGELKEEVRANLASQPENSGLLVQDIFDLAGEHACSVDVVIDPDDGVSLNVIFRPLGSASLVFGNEFARSDAPQANIGVPCDLTQFSSLANTTSRSREETYLRTQIREYLTANLPAHAMPDVILTMDEWPRTPSGKIDWKRLPSPNIRMLSGTAGMQHAGTNEEKLLVEIWKLVIGIDDVSVHDVFFEIGGTSLLLTQVHQMLQNRLKRTIPLTVLFQHPTIHSLGKWLAGDMAQKGEEAQTGQDMLRRTTPRGKSAAVKQQRQRRLQEKGDAV